MSRQLKLKWGRLLPVLFLSVIVSFAVAIRLIPILTGRFFFHFDPARDWLWVRDLVILKRPTLIGPWASLQGIFYGPLTYYFLAIFFWLFNGHPIGGSVYVLLANSVALVIFFYFLRRVFNNRVAFFGLILLSFSSISLHTSTFIFPSNHSILLTVLFLLPLYRLTKGAVQALPWVFFLVGLGVHVNLFWPVFLIPYVIFLVYWLRVKLSLQLAIKSLVLFLTPLLPQIVFDLRHEFLQTKSLLAFISGQNQSLGGNLTFLPQIIDRLKLFFSIYQQSVGVQQVYITLFLLALVSLTYLASFRKSNNLEQKRFLVSLIALIGFFFIEAVIFPAQFKLWYIYGLAPIFALLVSVVFDQLYSATSIAQLLVIGYLFFFSLSNVQIFLPKLDPKIKEDMGLFKNQQEVVSRVLEMGRDDIYAVYTYTEPIYDYPYQYLFWWWKRQTGQGPVKYSYLPDKYEYVSNKRLYDPEPQEVETIFLIMEKDNPASYYSWETWLPAFGDYVVVNEVTLANGTRIEKRVGLDRL